MGQGAWFIELKRRGKRQRLLQVVFWITLVLWCVSFGVLLGRIVGE
jgi:hypothetical protein